MIDPACIKVRLPLFLGVTASLFGCAVGPDFTPPDAPTQSPQYTEPLPEKTIGSAGKAGKVQTFVVGQSIPDAWWTLYQSEALAKLVALSIQDSPSLVAAQANLRQAQEMTNSQWDSLVFPTIDANPSFTRQKIAGASLQDFGPEVTGLKFSPYNIYSASVKMAYSLDLWGGGRRYLEYYRAVEDYQNYELQAAYLALTSNIVTTAIKEASLRGQIKATKDIIHALSTQLEAIQNRYRLGAISQAAVLSQRTDLAQIQVTLPALENALSQTRHQLAVLAGKLPNDNSIPEFHLEMLRLPEVLPVSLPSDLVRQRPDILAAEAQLHQASAQIGVATAAMLPQLNLSATDASQGAAWNKLFTGGSNTWTFVTGITQPIFHGGALFADRRAAVAAFDAAKAQYQQTVLHAFQNVADSLRALEDDAKTLKIEIEAESFARKTLELSKKQYELGSVSYLELLTSEQQYQQAHISRVQAEAARYSDTAALFASLGGGWWNRVPKKADD